jgi:hypothetical protein
MSLRRCVARVAVFPLLLALPLTAHGSGDATLQVASADGWTQLLLSEASGRLVAIIVNGSRTDLVESASGVNLAMGSEPVAWGDVTATSTGAGEWRWNLERVALAR